MLFETSCPSLSSHGDGGVRHRVVSMSMSMSLSTSMSTSYGPNFTQLDPLAIFRPATSNFKSLREPRGGEQGQASRPTEPTLTHLVHAMVVQTHPPSPSTPEPPNALLHPHLPACQGILPHAPIRREAHSSRAWCLLWCPVP